jgi:sugar phosphate isomerase/epimerase
MTTRRDFLRSTSAALAGLWAGNALAAPTVAGAPSGPEISIFTKHLIGLSHRELAAAVARIGVTSIEAPVRSGGHVLPAQVEVELPKLVEALAANGITISMLTTGINAVSDTTRTEAVLRTAKALGIKRYRMNWYAYAPDKPLWAQLDELKPRLRDLVALSKEIGIQPCYQNHSGAKNVGAAVWDMAALMREYRPEDLAWSFDILHATVEGGLSWPNQVALARERMAMAYFKNFRWKGRAVDSCPLAAGVIDAGYVKMLKASRYQGPVCLHVEYLPEGSLKDATYLKRAVAASRQDLATLRGWWG